MKDRQLRKALKKAYGKSFIEYEDGIHFNPVTQADLGKIYTQLEGLCEYLGIEWSTLSSHKEGFQKKKKKKPLKESKDCWSYYTPWLPI